MSEPENPSPRQHDAPAALDRWREAMLDRWREAMLDRWEGYTDNGRERARRRCLGEKSGRGVGSGA
jgi:hypothetical protein